MTTRAPALFVVLTLWLTACGRQGYPALLPFEDLTPPPPAPVGIVEGLQAEGAALQAAAAAQRETP